MSMSLACDYVMFGRENIVTSGWGEGRMPWHCHNHVLNGERLLNTQNAAGGMGACGWQRQRH